MPPNLTNWPRNTNAKVVYACDDEGNYFNEVGFVPSSGNYSEDGEFKSEPDEDFEGKFVINSVCLN